MTDANKGSHGAVAVLRAKLEKATPGVWAISHGGEVAAYPDDHALPDIVLGATEWRIEDEELACEARNALSDLLRVIEALAAKEPTLPVYNGNDTSTWCAVCGANDREHERQHPDWPNFRDRPVSHAPGCAWVLACRLVKP